LDPIIAIILMIVALAIGVVIGFIIRKVTAEAKLGSAEEQARHILEDAIKQAESAKKESIIAAKEEIFQLKREADFDIKERRKEVSRLERRITQKEESLAAMLEALEKKEQLLTEKHANVDKLRAEVESTLQGQLAMLEKIAGMTAEEAKAELVARLDSEMQHETAIKIAEYEEKFRDEADMRAKDILSLAIQRCAADHVSEISISTVQIPGDEMKGRIIGREGRNIRTIETLTGVDLIIDDTPEAVILSGFDPVRREIARIALEKLIVDGRIHPARIEEMVEKAEKEVNAIIKEEGEQATFEVGIHNLHPELVKLLGRLRFRTSYGQNVLKHSVEVAHLAGLMAGELGLDVKLAKRAGLLHDIGKALDHEVEGTHVDIGIDVLRKYKESEAVINGMAAHHGDYEAKSMEAVLIAAADALSAARPGARRETLDAYIKRLEKLEEIANTTAGVEKSFAIQAGREIRIIAKPEDVNDDGIVFLAREISKKIEAELEYPGQIKVNVVRETRAIDYAK